MKIPDINLKIKKNDIKKFTASNALNPDNKVYVELKITRCSRLLVFSGLFANKNIRYSADYNKIDHATMNTLFKLETTGNLTPTYIGTVGSAYSDMSMDIYFIQETVGVEPEVVSTLGYFVVFPTLLLLPNVTNYDPKKLALETIVFGILDKQDNIRSSNVEIPTTDEVYSYINGVSFTAPTKLAIKLINFPGIDEDSQFDSTELYTTGGQYNGNGSQPSQYIELGDVATIISGFDPLVGIDLYTSGIKQTGFGVYAYGKPELINIKSGILCLPLNF